MTQVADLSRSLVAFEQNSCRAPCSGIAKGACKTGAIVALARKLLIMLWRMVNTGQIPQDLVLRPAT